MPRQASGAGSWLECFCMELSLPSGTENLLVHRRRLETVCRIAMSEPSILGMLIGGSFATGEADVYSDLDMS